MKRLSRGFHPAIDLSACSHGNLMLLRQTEFMRMLSHYPLGGGQRKREVTRDVDGTARGGPARLPLTDALPLREASESPGPYLSHVLYPGNGIRR